MTEITVRWTEKLKSFAHQSVMLCVGWYGTPKTDHLRPSAVYRQL